MYLERANGNWVIFVSFAIAIVLSMQQYGSFNWLAPRWIPLVLIYWVITLPHRIGIAFAWLLGLFVDLLEGSLLGQNALAMSVIAYVLLVLYQRMRMYDMWQQACVVFVLIGLYQLLCYWAFGLTGVVFNNMSFLFSALASALLWPWVWLFLRRVTQVFEVS